MGFMRKVTVLNSRQGLRPVGNDPWIINSERAIDRILSRGDCVFTSVGLSNWEIPLFLASKMKVPQIICFFPDRGRRVDEVRSHYEREFCLKPEQVTWDFLPRDKRLDKRELQIMRDHHIVDSAELIYPVSVRPGGNMEKLLEESRRRGKIIDETFRTEYHLREDSLKIEIDTNSIERDTMRRLVGHLIHWTRGCHGPWPGETRFDYYDAVMICHNRYPRSGLDTLKRILSEGKIRASSRHMRSDVLSVAFSSLTPMESLELMRWRARYREMTFEPYGIAVPEECAAQAGVRKVFYGNPEMYQYLDDDKKPYFQSLGTIGHWLPENEYRHIGDFEFENCPGNRIIAIVRNCADAAEIPRNFAGQVVALWK